MTNRGFVGFPSTADVVPDGSITAAKLAAPVPLGRLVSGLYYFPVGCGSLGLTTGTLTTGTLRVAPWFVPHAVTLSVIGAEVTSGTSGDVGSKVRLGIYADNGGAYPGVLVLDAGTIAGDSVTVQDIAVNLRLSAGLYWIGGVTQVVSVTQPTVRATTTAPAVPISVGTSAPSAGQNVMGYSHFSVAGALPAVFSSSVSGSGTVLRTHVKVA